MIGRLLQPFRPLAHTPDDDYWYNPFGAGQPTAAGVTVSEEKSLTLSAMFRAIDWLSGHLAMLPLPVFRRLPDDGRERVPSHRVTHLLNTAPNEDITAFAFRRSLHLHAHLWGTAYAEITEDAGNIAALELLSPNAIVTMRNKQTKKLYHDVRNDDGTMRVLDDDQVVRIPALGAEGVTGYGLIATIAKENIGLALAIHRYASAFFGNNTALNVILSAPTTMRKNELENLRREWNEGKRGPDQAFRVALMHGGVKVEKFGQENEAAQLIESMTFSVQDVARWTGVPPPLLMELSRATFSNITEQALWYVKYTLTPWFKLYEQEFTRKLLRRSERDEYYIEFVAEGLLRGDITTMYEALETAVRNGWMNRNEARRLLNLNSIGPEGDLFTVEQNMTTLGRLAEEPEPEVVGQIREVPDDTTDDQDADREDPPAAVDAHAGLRQQIADAHKPLLAEALGRMLKVEITAARRAEKKGITLTDWAKAFYGGDYPLKLRAALIPSIEALGGAVRATLPATTLGAEWDIFIGEYTRALTERSLFESRSAIIAGVELLPLAGDAVDEFVGSALARFKPKGQSDG